MKILILFMLLCSSAYADEWTSSDTTREVTYQVLQTIDWLQTRNIAKHPDQFSESNAVLGFHPSVKKVNAYFAFTGIAHYFISKALDSDDRHTFQYGSIAVELYCDYSNRSVGLSMNY